MFENMSFEGILERMLDRVPNNMDKREGSIIYDALAPAAMEIMSMYLDMENIIKETFAQTASREYLIKRAAERGIIPYSASFAYLKAESKPETLEIPIGARFSFNDLNYTVVSKISDGEYQIQCETAGTIGNKYFGKLIPIDYIQGLESIEITELLIPGEDDEDTESIRSRYFETFDTKAFGGNVKDYIEKTNSIAGVGATKVTPVWNGGGTVLLTILNSEFKAASSALIEKVQNEIDPTKDRTGVGIAPIGHAVTVRTANETAVNIKATIIFQEGYDPNALKQKFVDAVEEYLSEIRRTWANDFYSVVRISQIDNRILNVPGVLDITKATINGAAENLVLDEYAVPILGVITIE